MSLALYCRNISCNQQNQLKEDHEIGTRMMCPEYSLMKEDVKTYPLPKKEQMFVICWCMQESKRLYSTLLPSKIPFSYSCSFTPGDRTQLHTHEYIELAYIVKGAFKQNILGKSITFKKGEFCLIDKNCLHQDYLENQNATIIFIGIANEIFNEIMEEDVTTEKIIAFLKSALMKQKNLQQYLHFKPQTSEVSDKMQMLLLSILQELMQQDAASPYICKGLFMRIFGLLSSQYDFSLSKEMKKEMNWILFGSVTEYMKDHFTDVSIQNLVNKFHFQEDYFNRLIKSKTGLTYSAYLQSLRLTEAKRLLRTSNMSIESIAETVGYRNKGYFYKIFTKHFGMTPAKMRQSMKEYEI